MTFDDYQKQAKETAVYPKTNGISYTILGLTGEAGEVANEYKKCLRDDGGVLTEDRRKKLLLEIGDLVWYISALCGELGIGLDAVSQMNLRKLKQKKEDWQTELFS